MTTLEINLTVALGLNILYACILLHKADKKTQEVRKFVDTFRQMYYDEKKAHAATKSELELYKNHNENS